MSIATKVLISMTTIPSRMGSSTMAALDAMVASGHDVVLSVPEEYRKWGAPDIPSALAERDDIALHRPKEDFGPATKLLGALDWLETLSEHEYSHVVTFDDDIWYFDQAAPIAALLEAARAQDRPTAVTFGGIRLVHPPYRKGDGLTYDNVGFVDAVAGYRGVLYPLEAVWPARATFFSLRHELPPGIFHDDDAYFGMALAHAGIPLLAIVADIPQSSPAFASMEQSPEMGRSGVEFGTDVPRRDNEMQLFQYAVERGLLPNPFSPQPGRFRRLLFAVRLERLPAPVRNSLALGARALGVSRTGFVRRAG